MALADATIRDWLKALGVLAVGSMTPQEFKARIDAMTTLLAAEFAPGAFTPASLAVVARGCRHFPTYAELCDVLAPWWREHRPTPAAIPGDQSATVRQREIDREVSESWANITAAQVRAKLRDLDGHPMRNLLGDFLATALRKHASHHVALLPPEWLKDGADGADVVALRRPPPERPFAVLSAEQLQAARDDLQQRRAAALGIKPEVRRGPATPNYRADAVQARSERPHEAPHA
jgi:hypothetical protein